MMSTTTSSWGVLETRERRVQARLKRQLGHSVEQVWAMLTEERLLPLWLAPGQIEPCLGGRAQIDFGNSGCPIDSTLTRYNPPWQLAYSWSHGQQPVRPVTWELQENSDGTRLTLTLDLPDDDHVAIACAGWDAHLEMLMAALEGIAIHFPTGRFQQARQAFSKLAAG
ncbi:Uncharacterized conserved protein YndB, AHSA1/START domain [Marinobacter mobilis]|uniref:Uncharacterized conserved protein YndB, AHSA1/START domain n=1 Tax=Marinobacter mobilis TaxID=488533 RepID=A0A1H2R0N9_9GAMM|nr:Uncharacterized conserved protein YndB, AHSA1/START domain [Marinobacter mobilis]